MTKNRINKNSPQKQPLFANLGSQNLTIAKGECKACFKTEEDFYAGIISVRDMYGNTARISVEEFIEFGGKGIEIKSEEV